MKFRTLRFDRLLRDMPTALRIFLFVVVAAMLFIGLGLSGPMLAVAGIAVPEVINLGVDPDPEGDDDDDEVKILDLARNKLTRTRLEDRAVSGMKWVLSFLNGDMDGAQKLSAKSWEKSTLAPNNETTNADGGYLVPAEFAADIAYYISQVSLAVKTFPTITMKGRTMNISTLSSRPSVAWYSENATIAAVKLAFGRLTLNTSKIAVITAFSNELWEDANVDVYQHTIAIVGGVMAKEIDTQVFRGTGTPWTGIATTGSVNTVYLGNSSTSGKTHLTDITWDDLTNLVMGLDPEYAEGGTIYLPKQAIAVLMNIKDTAGQYVYQQMSWALEGSVNYEDNFLKFNFRGIPVVACADKVLTSLTWGSGVNASSVFGFFFNAKKAGTWIGRRTDLHALIEQSGTVDGVDAFANDLQFVRLTQRLAFGVAQPSYINVLSTSAS